MAIRDRISTAPGMTWRDRYLARLVLDHQIGDNPCYPSDRRLMSLAGLGKPRAVAEMRRSAVDAGIFEVSREPGKGHLYSFANTPPKGETPERGESPQKGVPQKVSQTLPRFGTRIIDTKIEEEGSSQEATTTTPNPGPRTTTELHSGKPVTVVTGQGDAALVAASRTIATAYAQAREDRVKRTVPASHGHQALPLVRWAYREWWPHQLEAEGRQRDAEAMGAFIAEALALSAKTWNLGKRGRDAEPPSLDYWGHPMRGGFARFDGAVSRYGRRAAEAKDESASRKRGEEAMRRQAQRNDEIRAKDLKEALAQGFEVPASNEEGLANLRRVLGKVGR